MYLFCGSPKLLYLCNMNSNIDFIEDDIYGDRLLVSGMMEACYVVYNGEAVVVNAMEQTRREIESIINELKP